MCQNTRTDCVRTLQPRRDDDSALGVRPLRDRRLLLLAGGSAGVGAMFHAPLGGALFMPEVLYRKSDLEADAIIPCIISSIFAYATFTTISSEGPPLGEALPSELLFEPRTEQERRDYERALREAGNN